MTERKTPWTEAPWVFDVYEGESAAMIYRPVGTKASDTPVHVATVRRVADAHLFVAAPEMADCLEENIDSVERILADLSYHEGNDEIRSTLNAMRDDCVAVLAKAWGEQ